MKKLKYLSNDELIQLIEYKKNNKPFEQKAIFRLTYELVKRLFKPIHI